MIRQPVPRSELDAFGLFEPNAWQDPYPIYGALRQHAPVLWSASQRAWIVTRYRDTWKLQERNDLSVNRRESHRSYLPDNPTVDYEEIVEHFARWLLYMDEEPHERLKNLFQRAFTPAAVKRMRPQVQQIVDSLLQPLARDGSIEAVSGFAQRVPLSVVCQMLGLPVEDQPMMADWTARIMEWLFQGVGVDKAAVSDHCLAAVREQRDYFGRLLADRRARPREDLLTAMVQAEASGDRMTQDEIHSTCTLLLVAGNATTMSLIASALYYLCREPEQRRALRGRSALLGTAVEEVLRYEAPTQRGIRTALRDFVLSGVEIRRGDIIHMMIGSANRDPEAFADPDRFDVTRTPNRHASLGHGIHFCLGAYLARTEAQVALESMLERFPNYRVDEEQVRWKNLVGQRCLDRLPVSIV
jgi:cytochrome P450